MSSLSWKKAAGLSGLGLAKEEKSASAWPELFEFKALSVLQYPGDGTPSGGKVARPARKALLDALAEAAGKGEISIEQRPCRVEAFRDVPVQRCPYERVDKSVSGFTNDEWRKLGGRFKRVPAGFETILRPIVSRRAFRQWLDEQGEPPSVYVRAWFDSGDEKPDVSRFFADTPGVAKGKAQVLPGAEVMSAGRLTGFDGRDGWPDELSVKEFVDLQFNGDDRARADFLGAMWGGEWSEWIGEHGVTVIRDNAPGPGFCRASAAECLRLYGVEPSKLVGAWIESAGGKRAGLTPPQSDRSESPGPALESILSQCEKRAAAAGMAFDVGDMPGQIPQFWELCKRLDPVFKRQTSIESFKRYTKAGRCKWSISAKANPDATPKYQKLFPEAWLNAGAATEKHQKA